MRREKGITLIALVITIVVLLILAAVSITALTDEDKGVVTKAKKSAQLTEDAANKFNLPLYSSHTTTFIVSEPISTLL